MWGKDSAIPLFSQWSDIGSPHGQMHPEAGKQGMLVHEDPPHRAQRERERQTSEGWVDLVGLVHCNFVCLVTFIIYNI